MCLACGGTAVSCASFWFAAILLGEGVQRHSIWELAVLIEKWMQNLITNWNTSMHAEIMPRFQKDNILPSERIPGPKPVSHAALGTAERKGRTTYFKNSATISRCSSSSCSQCMSPVSLSDLTIPWTLSTLSWDLCGSGMQEASWWTSPGCSPGLLEAPCLTQTSTLSSDSGSDWTPGCISRATGNFCNLNVSITLEKAIRMFLVL